MLNNAKVSHENVYTGFKSPRDFYRYIAKVLKKKGLEIGLPDYESWLYGDYTEKSRVYKSSGDGWELEIAPCVYKDYRRNEYHFELRYELEVGYCYMAMAE